MTDILTKNIQLFSLLEGTWRGEGRGEYPGVTSFDYRETLFFTRRNEKSMAYEQRTQKRYDGTTEWLVSHWENGFLRSLENGELELVSAQIGRTEVLTGTVETGNSLYRIHFVSKTITNDPRMICTTRSWELEHDTLHYEVNMQTTNVDELTKHLEITLQRVESL